MLRKLITAAAVLLTLMVLCGAFTAADARHGGHGHFRKGGGHHFAVGRARHARMAFRRHRHARFHRWHRRRFIVAGHYYGHRRCRWLRYRALATGSRYWWRRYWRCRHGYRYYY